MFHTIAQQWPGYKSARQEHYDPRYSGTLKTGFEDGFSRRLIFHSDATATPNIHASPNSAGISPSACVVEFGGQISSNQANLFFATIINNLARYTFSGMLDLLRKKGPLRVHLVQTLGALRSTEYTRWGP